MPCECGCGQPTTLITVNNAGKGQVAGTYRRFRKGHHRRVGLGGRKPLTDRYEVDPETGCWLWRLTVSAKGYGYDYAGRQPGESRLAHVRAYVRAHGPVPPGMQLDHLCHTRDLSCPGGGSCIHRRCVNPDHLEPVTALQNIHRGRHQANRTHCPQGHPYDEANTKVERRGDGGLARRCRACRAAQRRQRYVERGT